MAVLCFTFCLLTHSFGQIAVFGEISLGPFSPEFRGIHFGHPNGYALVAIKFVSQRY
jgi:hypothetical protein